jgi:Raf kinase inhibitor-like YbhB/YbcL family protein
MGENGVVNGRRVIGLITSAAIALAVLGGCGGDDTVEGPPPEAPATIQVSSEAFADGDAIPARYTCEGEDVSPALAWTGVPDEARALALLVEDPDAPDGTFVHWTLFDLPPDSAGLSSGVVPAGAREGENSFGDGGYGGPCPPEDDEPHRYVFVVYALDAALGLDAGATPSDVRAAIGRHAIARGELTGRFGR